MQKLFFSILLVVAVLVVVRLYHQQTSSPRHEQDLKISSTSQADTPNDVQTEEEDSSLMEEETLVEE